MAIRQKTLTIAKDDEHLALRILSAVILGWDRLQFADQGWLLRDAFIMVNGKTAPTPMDLLEFVNSHKDSTLPAA